MHLGLAFLNFFIKITDNSAIIAKITKTTIKELPQKVIARIAKTMLNKINGAILKLKGLFIMFYL